MGISGLLPFLRKQAPGIFQEIHISQFAHKSLAVDIYGFIHKFKVRDPNKWIDAFVHLICALKQHKVFPILVCDGGSPPEKKVERERRSEVKQKTENRYTALREALDAYQNTGIISEVLLTEMKGAPEKPSLVHKKSTIDLFYLNKRLDSLDSQSVRISSDEIQTLQDILDGLGLTHYKAPDEGERFCCNLVSSGMCSGVVANDTDVFAYGVQNFIYDFNPYSGKCFLFQNDVVLKELGMTQPQFRDFCIMCGTDYNDNIPKIGPVNAFKKMIQHKSIDELDVDTSVLNHVRVRELFTPVPMDIKVNLTSPDIKKTYEILVINNCRVKMSTLEQAFKEEEIIFED